MLNLICEISVYNKFINIPVWCSFEANSKEFQFNSLKQFETKLIIFHVEISASQKISMYSIKNLVSVKMSYGYTDIGSNVDIFHGTVYQANLHSEA